LGFPLYHQLVGKNMLSNTSTAIVNQTFGAGVTKKNFIKIGLAVTQECDQKHYETRFLYNIILLV